MTPLIVATCTCLGLVGCFGDGTTPGKEEGTELPYSGQTVRISAPAGLGFPREWEGPLREWQAQTGAQAELTEYDPTGDAQPVEQFSKTDSRTLVVFPLERVGDLIAADVFTPLSESIRDDLEGVNWLDLFAGLRDGLAAPRRRPTLVPLSCPVLVCYYRRDLLEQSGLAPPQTWDDYQKLLDGLETWAPGQTALEPWGPEFRGTMFLARSAAFAKHPGHYSFFFDIETGNPLIDSPGFVRGLDVARRAWDKLSPDSRELSPADCRNRILQGKAALAIGLEPENSADASAADPATNGENATDGPPPIGVCRLPGSRESYNPTRKAWETVPDKGVNHVTLVGFAGLACAASAHRSAAEIDAAWNAISRIGSRGFASGFPPSARGLCRESQAASGLGSPGAGLPGDGAAAYRDAVAQSLRDARQVVELPVLRHADFRAALADALLPVLEGRETSEESLKKAAGAWTRLIEEIGAPTLRDNYRAALGLSAAARGPCRARLSQPLRFPADRRARSRDPLLRGDPSGNCSRPGGRERFHQSVNANPNCTSTGESTGVKPAFTDPQPMRRGENFQKAPAPTVMPAPCRIRMPPL
jgi:multiple sugar transport system substrate-binding protein